MTDEELNAASMALRPSNVAVSVGTSTSEDSTTIQSSDDSESSDMNEMLQGGDAAVSRVLRFLPQDTPRSASSSSSSYKTTAP